MIKIKDPVILGGIAGSIGNLVKNVGNEISMALGYSKLSYAEIAGGIFMKRRQTMTLLGKAIGYFGDSAIGGALGVGLVYILKATGKDHAIEKGIGYSHIVWTILLGGINKVGISSFKAPDRKTVLSSYINHTLYGIVAALAITMLGDEDLFAEEDIEKQVKKSG